MISSAIWNNLARVNFFQITGLCNEPYSRGGDIGHRQYPSLELKCLGTSFSGAKQKFSIPRDSTWPPCD